LLCILQKTDGEVKLGFNGDLYPTAGATSVLSTKGDLVRYNTERERYGIGSANQILQVKSNLPSWETVDLADTVLTTAGDVLFENATPELARLPKGTQYNNLQMGSALPAWSASSTSVLTGSMDILYSSSANTLARLGAGTSGDVLTTKGTGSAPTWETPSAGGSGGNLELIETKTATGTGTTTFDFTFASALNFSTDTSAMFWVVQGGADGSTDYRVRVGDTGAGAVFTTNYDLTVVGSATTTITGEDYFTILPSADYPEISAFGYITQVIDNDDVPYLSLSANVNGKGYVTIIGGKNTTTIDNTLKYFSCYVATSYFEDDSSCTCYKVKRA